MDDSNLQFYDHSLTKMKRPLEKDKKLKTLYNNRQHMCLLGDEFFNSMQPWWIKTEVNTSERETGKYRTAAGKKASRRRFAWDGFSFVQKFDRDLPGLKWWDLGVEDFLLIGGLRRARQVTHLSSGRQGR